MTLRIFIWVLLLSSLFCSQPVLAQPSEGTSAGQPGETELQQAIQQPLQVYEFIPAQAGTETDEAADESTRYSRAVRGLIDQALELVGIRYRRGGTKIETGFDCSGFVGFLYRQALGLHLPRTSREISKTGVPVAKEELAPGDLVFFNTMRRAFSHVGIYLGDGLFVHAARTGKTVRVESLKDRYWAKRFNGARRAEPLIESASMVPTP